MFHDTSVPFAERRNITMEESLQGDMEYMLNELGIAMPENSSGNTFSAYDYEGNWTWQQEDMAPHNISKRGLYI